MGLVNERPAVEWRRRVRNVTAVALAQTQLDVRLLDFALSAPLLRVCGVRGHVSDAHLNRRQEQSRLSRLCFF